MNRGLCDDCKRIRRLYTLWVDGHMLRLCAECERRRVGAWKPERDERQGR